MEALLLLISNYKQDEVPGTGTDVAGADGGWGMTPNCDQMMDGDGFLLPQLIAYFCDMLDCLFHAPVYLDGQIGFFSSWLSKSLLKVL